MKFHYPSFMHYFTKQFDPSFNIYAHNWTVRLIPPHRYFTWTLLQKYIIEALTCALERPLCPPDGPRSRSLFEAPPVPHVEALQQALQGRSDYAEIYVIQTEAGEKREFRIYLRTVQQIVIDVRKEQDTALAASLLQGEVFMSDRLLLKKISRLYGREFSKGRCQEIMQTLVEQGYCKNNGNLRTAGREVTI